MSPAYHVASIADAVAWVLRTQSLRLSEGSVDTGAPGLRGMGARGRGLGGVTVLTVRGRSAAVWV